MLLFAAFSSWQYLFSVPLILLSIFLILIILVQRGRGGGLTGALGGMGGQSAFGTKAGDLFTRITVVVALLWVLMSAATILFVGNPAQTGGLKKGLKADTTVESKDDSSVKDDKSAKGAKGNTGIGATDSKDKGAGKLTPEKEEPSDSKASSKTEGATEEEKDSK